MTTKGGRGSHWQDPEKAAQTAKAMREAWAGRRFFLVTWSDGREMSTTSLEEVSKLVHRSVQTLRVYLAHKHGVVQFAHDDEVITVRRVYR